jgi:hypothetical protein
MPSLIANASHVGDDDELKQTGPSSQENSEISLPLAASICLDR